MVDYPEAKNYDEAIEILKKGHELKESEKIYYNLGNLIRYNERDLWYSFFSEIRVDDLDGSNATIIGYHPDWPRFGELCLYLRYKMPKAFKEWKEANK